MNISPDGVTVRFKTKPEALFMAEKSGAKPNTVRVVDAFEAEQMRRNPPEKIIIQYQQEVFLRTITHIHFTWNFFGKVIVVISWTNEKHHHPIPGGDLNFDPYAHTMSLDATEPLIDGKGVSVTISRDLYRSLDAIAHGRSMNLIIEELYLALQYRREKETITEEPGPDRSIALIAISKGMLDTLTNIAQGRSMDKIIWDLYQIYLNKRAEEVGPLHD